MDSHTWKAFQNELTCPICMNYFLDPITIACGHNFCRPCLYLCWEEYPMRCPQCREISQEAEFKTNFLVKKLISLARQVRPQQIHISEEQVCGGIRGVKGLLCEANKTLLCGSCSKAPEHLTHSQCPVEWAAQPCREELVKKMDSLWTMTKEMQNHLNEQTGKTHSFMNNVALRKVMIRQHYQKMHLFLQEEEKLHLKLVDREAEEIFQQLQDSEVRMTQQKESLRHIYRELTETCHKPDLELLQDLRNILERTELLQMLKTQPVSPELTSWGITGIRDMLNNFRVEDPLSVEMTSCYIRLTEDMRSILFGDKDHDAPWEAWTAQTLAVCGAQAFTSGKHYWEVDVTHSSSWILGVCKDSGPQDPNIIVDPKDAFLLFSFKKNNDYSLASNSPPLIHYVQRPLSRVGVFVEYDSGTVSFYDVYKASLIYSFLPSPFSYPLRPFLYLCYT
ncbi:tripartite motif-containing protein 64-like [Nycticebus coucang]|uniref:tripartite motif-containing protein 64-like n=1 Tax=Nycticebus coucang TaxID=9470 RepID=UPI00234CA26C|nr:tripartite motif-containing protein 64-like [Nycticebus coucang]